MTSQPPATTAQRILWTILIVATLAVCYFANLNVIGFVGPDEPRYAWIARDMAESGDWVTPRLYGKPWFEKPPLLYWGGAIFFKLIPTHPEVAARLPSAVSALLATLSLAWLAWRTYGEECARWLLLLLPTSVGMIGFSHAAATDMPFAGMLTMAMVCAAVVLGLVRTNPEDAPILQRTPWSALFLFGFFLGLAVLAKGPAGIILSGGAFFFWAILSKRWRDAFRLLHPAAIATFCATALPWYILCARRNPDFFRIFIIEHNFKRFLTPEFQHLQPFWFYLPVLLTAVLPWTLLVIAYGLAGLKQLWRTRCADQLTLLFVSLAVFCLIFFTISKSKLPGYILPAFPPIGLLLASSLPLSRVRGLSRWPFLLNSFVPLLLLGVLFQLFHKLEPAWGNFGFPMAFRIASGCLLLSAVGSIVLASILQSRSALLVLQIGFLSFVAIGLSGNAGKTLDELVSARFAAQQYEQLRATMISQNTADVGPFTYHLHRAHQYSLNFYLRKELSEWDPDQNKDAVIFLSPRSSGQFISEMKCSEVNPFPIVAPCLAKPSLPNLGGRRQPQ